MVGVTVRWVLTTPVRALPYLGLFIFILGLLLWLALGAPSPTVDGDALIVMTVGLLVAASAWVGRAKALDGSHIAFGGAIQALYFGSSDLVGEIPFDNLTWIRSLRILLALISLVSIYWASRWVLSRGNKVVRGLVMSFLLVVLGVAMYIFRSTTVA